MDIAGNAKDAGSLPEENFALRRAVFRSSHEPRLKPTVFRKAQALP